MGIIERRHTSLDIEVRCAEWIQNIVNIIVVYLVVQNSELLNNDMAAWQFNRIVLASFLLHLCFIQFNSQPHNNEVRVVLLYPFSSCDQLMTGELSFAAAFLVAVDTINNSSMGFNFTLSIDWNDTRCSELVGIKAMSQQLTRSVHAFIGPGNESFCATSARVAAAWNIPMISYVSWYHLCYLNVRPWRAQ